MIINKRNGGMFGLCHTLKRKVREGSQPHARIISFTSFAEGVALRTLNTLTHPPHCNQWRGKVVISVYMSHPLLKVSPYALSTRQYYFYKPARLSLFVSSFGVNKELWRWVGTSPVRSCLIPTKSPSFCPTFVYLTTRVCYTWNSAWSDISEFTLISLCQALPS